MTTRNSKLLTAILARTCRPPSFARTRFTSTVRMRPISKEIPTLLLLLYAERNVNASSCVWQSAAQVKWVSCTAATFTPRFESSPSKREHLLGSLSTLIFKVARFRVIKPTYLTQCWLLSGNPRGEDANVVPQRASAEFSGNSAISGKSSRNHNFMAL